MRKVGVRLGTVDRIAGEIVRRRRLEVGLSQEALGSACGVSYQQIQKYEYGLNRVSLSALVRMAKGLGCSAADIVREVEEQLAGAVPED